ncbi:CHAT domain-containing protein [Nocardiopsis valliformis]|uniref:CHAT domain-containing protein n=1 Tax=Nocardiopsis valliformis TaxID=239974 RepID=UPI000346EC8C|nr:CHAT domain-containing protein [Nocardiopsis valliformis]
MREQWWSDLARWIRECTEEANPSLLLRPEVQETARLLTENPTEEQSDQRTPYLLGWFHFLRSDAVSDLREREEEWQAAVDHFSHILFYSSEEHPHHRTIPEEVLPEVAEATVPAAEDLLERAAAGDAALLDLAVGLWERVVEALPPGRSSRLRALSNLGAALGTRFGLTAVRSDADRGIASLEEALGGLAARSGDRRALYLRNLATAYQTRFEVFGTEEDLRRAVTGFDDAVSAAEGDTERLSARIRLGASLGARFSLRGDRNDLDRALAELEEVNRDMPGDHPERDLALSHLGILLTGRFDHRGDIDDLNRAVPLLEEVAVLSAGAGGGADGSMHLTNLGTAYRTRADRSGSLTDLDRAVDAYERAVQGLPPGHRGRPSCLINLGTCLFSRFEQRGGRSDLRRAVDLLEEADRTCPEDHLDRIEATLSLALARWIRFEGHPDDAEEHTGNPVDMDLAISGWAEALDSGQLTPGARIMCLSNLAGALARRADRPDTQDAGLADLHRAAMLVEEVLGLLPPDHPERALDLGNLGSLFHGIHERGGENAGPEYLGRAVSVYESALGVAGSPVLLRLRAGRIAGELLFDTDPGRAARILSDTVALLPHVSPRALERTDRQHVVGQSFGLASLAAAAALADPGRDEQARALAALQVLETGRGVLLSQRISNHGELAELREVSPELAERFLTLREELDRADADLETAPPRATAGNTTSLLNDLNARWGKKRDSSVRDRHALARALDEVTALIRSVDGFASFGRAPSPEELTGAASEGPVVVFSTSPKRCDALLLTGDGITHCPLPRLDFDDLMDRAVRLTNLLHGHDDPDAGEAEQNPNDVLVDVQEWLWERVTEPVLLALGFDREPAQGQARPRVWWVPDGLLGLLPLHASGRHTERAGHTVMDRVVSSYTPTVRALRHTRTRAAGPGEDVDTATGADSTLVVAMPTTPGATDLAYVRPEREALEKHLPGAVVLATHAPGGRPEEHTDPLPTREAVLRHLEGASIAHFACHGYDHRQDPALSGLLLHDHARAPFTAAVLSGASLGRARLAYLSACNTSLITAVPLLDEVLHLASAFQIAGFPQVVGTLWRVNDEVSAQVADLFYGYLRDEEGRLEPEGSARALHAAVRDVRDGRGDPEEDFGDLVRAPTLWAPYLHTGC